MRKPRKNLDNLKKGNTVNNNGRPKKFITQVTEATGYKKSEVTDCMLSMLKMPLLDIKRVADDPKTPSLEVMVARAIHGDCKRGELKNLSEILNRSFGKPHESVDMTTQGEKISGKVVIIKIPDNGRD